MTEERMFILRMLEEGKITAEEAAQLLDALQTSAKEEAGTAGDPQDEGFEQTMVKVREYVDKMRERLEEGVQKMKTTIREKGPSREDIDNAVKQFQRGLSNVLDEIPEVVNRLSSFEFRTGPGHTYEEVFAGRLNDEQPIHIVVHNVNGRIQVEPGDDSLSYKVKVVNRVHIEDEEEAKRLSQDSVVWHAADTGFELKAGGNSKVTAKVLVTLPRHLLYQADLVTKSGSLLWRGLNATSLTISSEDGAIVLEEVQADRVEVQGANGSLRLYDVAATSAHVSTVNGSVRFVGTSPDLHCRTENGSVRCTFVPADDTPTQEAALHRWDIGTVNGSLTVKVPTGDAFGYRCDLHTDHGKIVADLPHLITDAEAPPSHVACVTEGFDTKPIQVVLRARTSQGLIRLEAEEKEENS